MRPPTKLVAIAVVAAVASFGGIAIVALDKNTSSQAGHSEVPASSPITGVKRVLGATDYEDATKTRITIPGNDADPIFFDVPDDQVRHGDLEDFIGKRPIGAYRIVNVDGDALRALIRQANEQRRRRFDLQLLNETPVTLVASDAKEHSTGWQAGLGTWLGQVEGDETSHASFVIGWDGSVNGVIRSQNTGRVKIEPITGTPYHIVWQLSEGFERKID